MKLELLTLWNKMILISKSSCKLWNSATLKTNIRFTHESAVQAVLSEDSSFFCLKELLLSQAAPTDAWCPERWSSLPSAAQTTQEEEWPLWVPSLLPEGHCWPRQQPVGINGAWSPETQPCEESWKIRGLLSVFGLGPVEGRVEGTCQVTVPTGAEWVCCWTELMPWGAQRGGGQPVGWSDRRLSFGPLLKGHRTV